MGRKKYIKAMLIGIQAALEYRANMLLLLLSCVFPIFIQIFMWGALFANSGEQYLFNFSYQQMILYAVLATVISKIISADFLGTVAEDIKSGELSKYLIKPISYFSYIQCRYIGDKLVNIGVTLIITAAMLLLFSVVYAFSFSLASIFFFILAIFIAMILKFMMSYFISCIAFWFTEVDSILHAINTVGLVLSGAFFPLDIFGSTAMTILRIFPFYYTIYFPVNIINGMLHIEEIIIGISIQIGWILVFKFLIDRIWKKGLRLYIAAGG